MVPAADPLCLDPFLVVSVLRTRAAYTVVSKNLLEAMDADKLSHVGARALWLAVLHADNNPAFQNRGAKIFLDAARKGRFPGKWAGSLVDRLASAEGRPLVYGVLYNCKNGHLESPRVIDPDKIDTRRAEIGLAPYAEYLAQEANKCT